MTQAVLDAARFGRASGMAADILRCRQINQWLGTHITPWELDNIPAEWITALDVWTDGYPRVLQWSQQLDESMRRLRGRRQ